MDTTSSTQQQESPLRPAARRVPRLADLGTRAKLFVAMGVLVTLMTGTTVIGVLTTFHVRDGLQVTHDQSVTGLVELGTAQTAFQNRRAFGALFALSRPDDHERMIAAMEAWSAESDAAMERFLDLEGLSEEQREEGQRLREVMAEYDNAVMRGNLPAIAEGDMATSRTIYEQRVSPLTDEALELFAELTADADEAAEAQVATATEAATGSATLLMGAAAAGIALAVAFGVLIGRSIIRPLQSVKAALEAMAAGDLTARPEVRSRDEVGQMAQALTEAQESVRAAIATVAGSVTAAATASEELSATSEQIAAGAEETSVQAGVVSAAAEEVSRNVQTVAAGSEQMGASIREIAQSAGDAARVA
ncbi:HAMP domain-containing protein, partial [Thalassiella azotivora]